MFQFKDGKVINSAGQEQTEWDSRTHDSLCDALFPDDKVVRNDYMTRKRATSYTGHQFDLSRLANQAEPFIQRTRLDAAHLFQLGGERLVALYQAGVNFAVAAADLGISEATMRKWFSRWRAQAIAKGLQPNDLQIEEI